MQKFKTFKELQLFLEEKGYSRALGHIIRCENSDTKYFGRKEIESKDEILSWWNNNYNAKLNLKEVRVAFYLIMKIREEVSYEQIICKNRK